MFLPLSDLLCDVFISFSFLSLSRARAFYSKHKSLSRTLSLSPKNLFSGAMLFHESVVVVGDERATER